MLQGIVVRMCSQANYTTQVSMSTGLHLLAPYKKVGSFNKWRNEATRKLV